MTDRPGALPERRRHTRIAPKGTVILTVGDHSQRGRLANLAEGGMFVITDVGMPDRLLARVASVEIRLDGSHAEWVRGTANIVRIVGNGVALAFDTVPPMLLRLIDEMSTASRARLRVLSVMLVDATAERRSAMADGFRAAGCAVIESSTPLEAIVRLGESSFEPDLIAIADSNDASAHDLRKFVERDHPRVKLVAITDELLEPSGVVNWLSSADPGANLPNRVREMLGRRRPT